MAYMYGILSVSGWIAFTAVMALLALLPPRTPKDSPEPTGTDERHT